MPGALARRLLAHRLSDERFPMPAETDMPAEIAMHAEPLRRPLASRHHPRAPCSAEALLCDGTERRPARVRDIGPDGLFIATDRLAFEARFLTLRLRLPGFGPAFTVLGRVLRLEDGGATALKPRGIAIRFIDIAAGDRDRIRAYVRART